MSLRPIESAPKDGTEVVLYGRIPGEDRVRSCVSSWNEDWTTSPAYEKGWYFSAPGYSNTFEPTHWAPKPDDDEACVWREDEDGNWDTGCGKKFYFIDDGPSENGFSHCPYCGKTLKEGRTAAVPSSESEAS